MARIKVCDTQSFHKELRGLVSARRMKLLRKASRKLSRFTRHVYGLHTLYTQKQALALPRQFKNASRSGQFTFTLVPILSML